MLRRFAKKRSRVVAVSILAGFFLLAALAQGVFSLLGRSGRGGVTQIEGDTVRIRLVCHEKRGEIIELGLEEYLVGVVAAEMPAAFPPEALKAQAVAARTYAVRRLQAPDPRVKSISLRADLSSDPAINQAWIDDAEMKRRWGASGYAGNKKKITAAVLATRGQVLTYGGALIDPVYHASCGGLGTEDSGDVWKYDIPYLRGVSCFHHPEGDNDAVAVFQLSEVDRLLGTQLAALPAAKLSSGPGGLAVTARTGTGRVKTLSFAGKTISGVELRSKLRLKSTALEWQLEKNVIRFKTKGYGHGVGMCQHGAKAMAAAGKNYEEILKHYYTGVTLARCQ